MTLSLRHWVELRLLRRPAFSGTSRNDPAGEVTTRWVGNLGRCGSRRPAKRRRHVLAEIASPPMRQATHDGRARSTRQVTRSEASFGTRPTACISCKLDRVDLGGDDKIVHVQAADGVRPEREFDAVIMHAEIRVMALALSDLFDFA